MKQKSKKSSEPITRDFLEKTLMGFLEAIRREFSYGMETLTEKLENRFQEISDKSLTKLDGIAKELEGMREDKIIGSDQTARLQKKVGNHETRISKLEHAQQVA